MPRDISAVRVYRSLYITFFALLVTSIAEQKEVGYLQPTFISLPDHASSFAIEFYRISSKRAFICVKNVHVCIPIYCISFLCRLIYLKCNCFQEHTQVNWQSICRLCTNAAVWGVTNTLNLNNLVLQSQALGFFPSRTLHFSLIEFHPQTGKNK